MQRTLVADRAAFCENLLECLPTSSDSASIDALLLPLKDQIQSADKLSKPGAALPRGVRRDLERDGVALWNAITRLRRDDQLTAGPTKQTLLLRSRYFAFQLLHLGKRGGGHIESADAAELVYLWRLALKTAKSCIGECALSPGFKVFLLIWGITQMRWTPI
jgi:hypothetical protein